MFGGICMKKIKRIMSIFFIIISSVFLISCGNNKKEIYKDVQGQDTILREIATDDLISGFENKVEEAINNFDKAEIVRLNIYEDPLMMESKINKKKYNNITIEIILNFTEDLSLKDRDTIAKEYSDAIIKQFNHGDDGYFRLSNINIHFTIDGLTDRFVKEYYHSFRLFGEILENLEIQQDEVNFKAQTLVFDYIEAKKEIELDRIGLEDDSFIIQLTVFDPQQDGYSSIVKGTSDELSKLILKDDEIKDYLISKFVKDINIYWNMQWNKNNKIIDYNYIVE